MNRLDHASHAHAGKSTASFTSLCCAGWMPEMGAYSMDSVGEAGSWAFLPGDSVSQVHARCELTSFLTSFRVRKLTLGEITFPITKFLHISQWNVCHGVLLSFLFASVFCDIKQFKYFVCTTV